MKISCFFLNFKFILFYLITVEDTKVYVLLSLNVGQDELMICVALGYTSHLVTMIAHFLDVPLRYPVTCLGSRSLISDYIIEKLAEKERE